MATKPLPDQSLLLQLLRYEPETGLLWWMPRPASMFKDGGHSAAHNAAAWNSLYADTPALNCPKNGYRHGKLCGRTVQAHRVIWKMIYGTEPPEIDHEYGARADNRIENMRAATRKTNGRNNAIPVTNTSGALGVRWEENRKRWLVRIKVDGRTINLGRFPHLADAVSRRSTANCEYGFHRNHGRPQHMRAAYVPAPKRKAPRVDSPR